MLFEESGPFREDIISALNAAQVPWHLAHAASSLAGVKAAVKAGLGVTARPVEMMSPGYAFRVKAMAYRACLIPTMC